MPKNSFWKVPVYVVQIYMYDNYCQLWILGVIMLVKVLKSLSTIGFTVYLFESVFQGVKIGN